MIKLTVWLTTSDASKVQAGEIVVADPDAQGRLRGQFRYTQEFVGDSSAFALDPISLPLSAQLFEANRPGSGVHGVFEDSLPDDWGKKIMVRRYGLGRNEQRVPQLLRVLGPSGLGALGFEDGDRLFVRDEIPDQCYLEELQKQALAFERNANTVDPEMTLLFQAGSSPGGARPKVLVTDGDHQYIAKLSSIRDSFDVVALEAAAMELAGLAGLEVAQTRSVPCGGKSVLLVTRFDIHKNGGRNHLISMQTLLKADGYYTAGYRDMAQVLKQVSCRPVEDLQQLYKQLVFNVLLGNTDDHLKNFSMMNDGDGWRLTPAFDIVPNVGQNREHVLHINNSFLAPDRNGLIREASFFMFKRRQEIEHIIDSVVHTVYQWKMIFRKHGVPRHDIETLGGDIDQRIGRIKLVTRKS
jgi:serine/threonine-protein kinase HipA